MAKWVPVNVAHKVQTKFVRIDLPIELYYVVMKVLHEKQDDLWGKIEFEEDVLDGTASPELTTFHRDLSIAIDTMDIYERDSAMREHYLHSHPNLITKEIISYAHESQENEAVAQAPQSTESGTQGSKSEEG